MRISDVDFTDFVTAGVAGLALVSSVAGLFYRKWSATIQEKRKLEEKLQEAEISKSLQSVAQTVKQVSDNQFLLKESIEASLKEIFERIRFIEIEHAKGCALVKKENNYTRGRNKRITAN